MDVSQGMAEVVRELGEMVADEQADVEWRGTWWWTWRWTMLPTC